jgi:hypothetical protein
VSHAVNSFCSCISFRRVRKTAKATTTFAMSVCPSAWNSLAPTRRIFMKCHNHFSKIYRENSSTIKIWQKYRLLIWRHIYSYDYISLNFSENVSDKSCTGNQNTLCKLNKFFRKSCLLCDDVEKYCRTRQATDDNMTRRLRFACWTTQEHLLLFDGDND